MIELDVADLIVIAGEVLDIGTDAALRQLDVAAAEAALAEARLAGQDAASAAPRPHRPGSTPAGGRPQRAAAAEAAVALVHALLRHPPLPGRGEQVAVAAGLQFLAVNGWQAELDVPRAAVLTIEGLASGQLAPADAASWLEVRLSPDPAAPQRQRPGPALPPSGSRAGRIMLAPVHALRHRQHRQARPGPFVIAIGGKHGTGIRTPATGFMPFTGHALSSYLLAKQEASRRGQPLGPEHVLLGLASEGDGVAAKALERLGITREAVREQIGQTTGQSLPQAPPGRLPHAPPVRRMWLAVADEAMANGDDYIGTEHLLLGLFCDSDAAVVQTLARLGVGENEARAAITSLRAESGPERSAS
jgi:ATP-dependent Clp protease ATP-binding subunit ClpC